MPCFHFAMGFREHVEEVPTNTTTSSKPYLNKFREIRSTKDSKRTGLPGPSPRALANAVEEARVLVRRCAEPCAAGETNKGAIRRASQRLRFPFIRTRGIWYGE